MRVVRPSMRQIELGDDPSRLSFIFACRSSLSVLLFCPCQPAAAFKLKCVKCSRLDGAKLQSATQEPGKGRLVVTTLFLASSIAPAHTHSLSLTLSLSVSYCVVSYRALLLLRL